MIKGVHTGDLVATLLSLSLLSEVLSLTTLTLLLLLLKLLTIALLSIFLVSQASDLWRCIITSWHCQWYVNWLFFNFFNLFDLLLTFGLLWLRSFRSFDHTFLFS